MDRLTSPAPHPEQQAAALEMRHLLEQLIDGLPNAVRTVFILREAEGLRTCERSEVLEVSGENVKVRLHRARV
jgi:RNA polymerase sigma-70 factor (ECF subfamily)